MDADLRADAEAIITGLPVSLEMPAGTGKTQLVAAIAAIAEETGKKTLVLTHTHAGVDAIRGRLQKFGVSPRNVHIDTITGWAFDLVRSYPVIAGIQVPPEPDWSKSADYIAGAIQVAQSRAVREMHEVSFDYFIVDEYQDCNDQQHDFILAIAEAVPKTCVFGDRLQGIFDFRGQKLVDWDTQVFARFPLHPQTHVPHRWQGHNEELGQWLLDLRPTLLVSGSIDLSAVTLTGYSWAQRDAADPSALVTAALASHPEGESVLVLAQWPNDADALARDLRGMYSVMEDIQGRFMLTFLTTVDEGPATTYPQLVAQFAKNCFIGLASLDRAVLDKLAAGQTVGHLTRAGLEAVLASLDTLIANPTLSELASTMTTIESTAGIKLFKREAWTDVRKAVESASQANTPTVSSLARIRDALRHSGRRPAKRVVSRTLLVKGLEYDHVIIADASGFQTSRNLYVALTRARKTLTVFSTNAVVRY